MMKYVKITNDNNAKQNTDPTRKENAEKLTPERMNEIFKHYENNLKSNPTLEN